MIFPHLDLFVRPAPRARLSGTAGGAAGGAAGASAGSPYGPVGTYVGGQLGAAAGSYIEDKFLSQGKSSCREPACSLQPIEEWHAEAVRRGATPEQVQEVYDAAQAIISNVVANLPDVMGIRATAAEAFEEQIPNLRNGTMHRYLAAAKMADLVGSLPTAPTHVNLDSWGNPLPSSDAGGPSPNLDAGEKPFVTPGRVLVAALVLAGAALAYKERARIKNLF